MITYSELILLNNDVVQNVETLLNLSDRKAGIELMMDGKAWDCNLTAQREVLRVAAYDLHKEAIDIAAKIDASYVVVHPGFLGSPAFDREEGCEMAYEQMAKLAAYADNAGVKLAMENVGYKGQSIYTEEEFPAFLDNLPDNTYFLIDTGHAFLNGWDIPALIRKTNNRLIGLHLHDNNGLSDDHLAIGKGKIHWGPIFEAIKELYDQGIEPELVLEFAPGTDLKELERCHSMITEDYGIPD